MDTTSYGSTCKWADIEPGMLFSFSDGEKSCLAIKLLPNKGEGESNISAVLTPGFLDDTKPKILRGVNYFTGGIYQWDKVVIEPDASTLGFGSTRAAAIGDLLLAGDELHLTIKVEGPVREFFNVSTGKLLEKRPDRYVTFSSWSILLKADDGVKTIFQWPEGTAAEE